MSKDELKGFLDQFKTKIQQTVSQLPTHKNYVDNYCKADNA